MRLPAPYIIVVTLAAFVLGGATCLTLPGTSGGPSNTAWTVRTVNTGQNVRPTFTALQDIDKDGKMDVLVAYEGQTPFNPAVVIFFQSSSDSFTPIEIGSGTNLTGPAAFAIGDLDGDTLFDIVAACNGRLTYLHSPADPRNASGWTQNVIAQSDDAGTGQWSDVAIGDIDAANGPDIVACDSGLGRVNWFRSPAANIATGTGWTRIDIAVANRVGAASIALADFSGDSRLDVVSTAPGESTARIAWYRNPTNPATDTWGKFTVGNLTAARLALGDLNADGRSDVVATNPAGKQIGWYRRPSDATTAWNGFLLTTFSTATPVDVKVADVNGNGQIDVIVGTQSPGFFRWFSPTGSDQTAQWTENNLRDLDQDAARFATGDIDADGHPDVASGLRGSATSTDAVNWYENPF